MYRGNGYLNGKPYHGTSNRDNGGGCFLATMIIFFILMNAGLIYVYFWCLNDDSLFSGDDLWKTIILGFWIFEGVGLVYALFEYFMSDNSK